MLNMHDLNDLSKIPYLENGRGFDGADCYGHFKLYYQHILGIELPDYPGANKGQGHSSPLFITEIFKFFDKIEPGEVRAHDAILFHLDGSKPDHVGVMIDKRRLMQINEAHGCSIVNLSRMQKYFFAAYRHRSLL